MLVLTRRVGEAIRVDGPCEVRVLRNDGVQTRLGIEAERDVKILRSELVQKEADDADRV